MFSFLKKNSDQTPKADAPEPKQGWLSRLKSGLGKTRQNFSEGLSRVFLGKKTIDAELFSELETRLLLADIGVESTQKILAKLTDAVSRKQLSDPETLFTHLKEQLESALAPYTLPIEINAKPFVILTVGVNGAGKTTSIAKMAHYFQSQNKKVMLAAGDTFRAAAIEQLQVWGDRNNVPVIAQHSGADSASVIYDAMQAATARDIDILIADTAGRLHTQNHLMAELEKIKRVLQKFNPDAPHETMLVLDASMGQNALNQAQQFHQSIGLSGLTLTKLDGTAKGGILFAICEKMKLPIRFIGVGEDLDDLRPFEAKAFVEAMVGELKTE
jgi:fused signal recognition particle receptor